MMVKVGAKIQGHKESQPQGRRSQAATREIKKSAGGSRESAGGVGSSIVSQLQPRAEPAGGMNRSREEETLRSHKD